MSGSFEFRNQLVVDRQIAQFIKDTDIGVKRGIAKGMTRLRRRASEYIIPNTTDTLNPYAAAKKQPSTVGRLTSRTGKMKMMLKHKTDGMSNWKETAKLLTDHTMAIKSTVRVLADSKTDTRYRGLARIDITDSPNLYRTRAGKLGRMPKESKKTLEMRFKWESGIRGSKRPFILPVYKAEEMNFEKYLKTAYEQSIILFNRGVL